jgi:hypothetical protein
MGDQIWSGQFQGYLEKMADELGLKPDEKTSPEAYYSEKQKNSKIKISQDAIDMLVNFIKPLFESTGQTIWDVYGAPTGNKADEIIHDTDKPWLVNPYQANKFQTLIDEQRGIMNR